VHDSGVEIHAVSLLHLRRTFESTVDEFLQLARLERLGKRKNTSEDAKHE
jgi:hypothetical protein